MNQVYIKNQTVKCVYCFFVSLSLLSPSGNEMKLGRANLCFMMKNIKRLFCVIVTLSMLMSCEYNEQVSKDFVVVDVTKSYPKKELILQDFMDVEYVPLETTDEFLCQGFVLDITSDYIFAKNFRWNGELFIYDRNGKAIKKIKKPGQGPGEYTFILTVVFDEENQELFISDIGKKILVYDLDGNFKRSLKPEEYMAYFNFENFNKDNLLCHNSLSQNNGYMRNESFLLVSKQDGKIQPIEIPFKERISTSVTTVNSETGVTYGAGPDSDFPFIPYQDGWILMESSADTMYTFSAKKPFLTPFIARIPSIHTMDPKIFLFLSMATDRYYFMEVVKKEYDFNRNSGFPRTNLLYDKQKDKIFECEVYNGDYTIKKQVYTNWQPLTSEVVTCHALPAHELVVAYKNGWLKEGRLKDIAATLDEDSNPVLMLVKPKKH